MTERPILFSAPMVRALLSGAKTQTRRIVKPQPPCDDPTARWTYCVDSTDRASIDTFSLGVLDAAGTTFTERGRERSLRFRCPFGAPGDRLWVRETWAALDDEAVRTRNAGRVIYPHTHAGFLAEKLRHRPSIHMPRWASRITLEGRTELEVATGRRRSSSNHADQAWPLFLEWNAT